MASPKNITTRRGPIRKRGSIGIANGDHARDLAGKFNVIANPDDWQRLPEDGDGPGGLGPTDGGGSGYTPGIGCALFTRLSSTNYSGNRRQEIGQVGPIVDVGFKYIAMVYSHGVEISAVSGDSPSSIASKMAAAINATTAAQWNSAGSAPASGTAGFKPTASASGDEVTIILNWQNSFAMWAEGCNNTPPPPPPPPPPPQYDPGPEEPPPPPAPQNQAPIARAGDAITVQLPQNSVELNGTASTDPENTPLTFSWSMVDGPNMPTITGAATARPVISNLVAGYYTFRLTVFDTEGASSMSTVNVTVVAATAPPPPPPPPPGPSPDLNTAPVIEQYFGPFGPMGGAGGSGAKSPAATTAPPGKKTDWLLWAFIGLSATYILFAPNK